MAKATPPLHNLGMPAVVSTYISGHWTGQVLQQLQAIQSLPDGWDSHGSARPDPEIIRQAPQLLATLLSANDRLAKPHIHPTPSGGVQLHWELHDRYLEIDLLDAFNARFYFVDGEAKTEETGEFKIGGSLENIAKYLRIFAVAP